MKEIAANYTVKLNNPSASSERWDSAVRNVTDVGNNVKLTYCDYNGRLSISVLLCPSVYRYLLNISHKHNLCI